MSRAPSGRIRPAAVNWARRRLNVSGVVPKKEATSFLARGSRTRAPPPLGGQLQQVGGQARLHVTGGQGGDPAFGLGQAKRQHTKHA